MNAYVDFDDCLCETARGLATLCARLFNRPAVAYDAIRAFDLRASFRLDPAQYETLMAAAHSDDEILAYAPTQNAAETLRSWQASGLATSIVTGRPPSTRDASLEWLRRHGFPEIPLVFVDKYNRHASLPNETIAPLSINEFNALHFDLAIEDAPAAIELLARRPNCRVIIFARPWNTPRANCERLASWRDIAAAVGTIGHRDVGTAGHRDDTSKIPRHPSSPSSLRPAVP